MDPIENAFDYFNGIFAIDENSSTNFPLVPSLGEAGAAQYEVFQFNDAPDDLKEAVEVGKSVIERFSGVISAAVLKKNGDVSTAKDNYQANVWNEISGNIFKAFFSEVSSLNNTFKQTVFSMEIAKSVIDFAASVIAGDVSSFASYLEGFGSKMALEAEKTQNDYLNMHVISSHRLFKNESGIVFYAPELRISGTSFNQNQKAIFTSCGKIEKVTLDFNVLGQSAIFKIRQYMEDAKFKKSVNDFLDRFESKAIKETESYFDGLFSDVEPA